MPQNIPEACDGIELLSPLRQIFGPYAPDFSAGKTLAVGAHRLTRFRQHEACNPARPGDSPSPHSVTRAHV
ncbi:MAG: hypothetical protein M3430_19795 [Acidobacteriota bacterium]|nr:hypothetical protein [Acidobacteriota bacterium]